MNKIIKIIKIIIMVILWCVGHSIGIAIQDSFFSGWLTGVISCIVVVSYDMWGRYE